MALTAAASPSSSSLPIASCALYLGPVSRLRRPFLSGRYFFITVRRLEARAKLLDADFNCLALAFNRARGRHPFFLSAWVFLPDHWHAICAPAYPVTISVLIKSIKTSSTILINRRRAESGELWQARFFDRALRTVGEYNEKVDYIHPNPVQAGLVRCPEDWRWSSVSEYSGMSAPEQEHHSGLTIDRVSMPSDTGTRI